MISGTVVFLGLRERYQDQGEVQTRTQLQATEEAFENLLDSHYQHLESAAHLIGDAPRLAAATETGDPRTVEEEANFFRASGQTDILAVTGTKGETLVFIDESGQGVAAPGGESPLPGIEEALAGRTARGLLRVGNLLYMTAASPVKAGGEAVGALLVGLRLDDRLAGRIRDVAQVDVVFVAGGGAVASSMDPAGWPAVEKALGAVKPPPGFIMPVSSGTSRLLCLSGLYSPGGATQLTYYLLLDLAPFLEAQWSFERFMLLGTLAFMVLLTLVTNYLSRRIIGGIEILVEAAGKIARGNFDPRFEVKSQDEIGYLAHIMQELSKSVGRRVHQLQRMNENLRGKIEDILFNETLGEQYTDVDILGRGGMGIVYRAYDRELGHTVAIKILSPMLAENAEVVQRFLREGDILRRLDHPGLVKVHGTAQSKLPYCVMEYFPGVSLLEHVAEHGPLPWSEAVAITKQLLDVVIYLHANGILHRDIKPSNVLLGEGHSVRIVDFGIAQDSQLTNITQLGDVLGTPQYVAPEIYAGFVASAQSDVFSTGMTLHFLLSARVVESPAGESGPLPHPPDRPPFPPALEKVVRTAIHPNPLERFGSAAEFRAGLESI